MKYLLMILCILTLVACKQKQASNFDQHVVLENDKVTVTEFVGSPGGDVCGEGMHSHPPHLNVLLTDAKVKVMLPDGKIITQNLPAGATFWSGAETHSVKNTGNVPVKSYIIVTKN